MNDREQKEQPVFPSYQPPTNPTGHTYAHPKQVSPLMKVIKLHIKPRPRMKAPRAKPWKKKNRFY